MGQAEISAKQANTLNSIGDFVVRAYLWVFFSLLVMTATALYSYYRIPQTFEVLLSLCAADSLIWIACGWFNWRKPVSLTFSLFTIISGLLLGQIAVFDTAAVLAVAAMTLSAFAGLTVFVWMTRDRFNFSSLSGYLFVAFFVLLGGWIADFFIQDGLLTMLWSGLGAFTFGCWILYDTDQIIARRNSNDSAAEAGFDLIMDIVGLFRHLFRLIAMRH